MIWLILFLILVTIMWYKYRISLNHWKKMGVKPSNKSYPFFGDMGSFIFKRIAFDKLMENLYYLYPNERYVGCYEFTKPALLLRDPELIKQTLIKDFEYFTDRSTIINDEGDPFFGRALGILTGQKWREMRATLSGSFTSSKMKTIFHLMEEASDYFVKFFLSKSEDIIEVEMKETFSRITNDVIATAAFGIKCDSLAQPKNELYLTGQEIQNIASLQAIVKAMGYNLIPKIFTALKITIFPKKFEKFFRKLISEAIKVREDEGIKRPDMINLLLEARKGTKEEESDALETGFATVQESSYNAKVKKINITNDIIVSQALNFYIAGFETVSTAMCFGSYELALNKEIQARLREEIKETYKKNNGKITHEILLKMKYLDMVVSEILRIWSPVISVDRQCKKQYTIDPVLPSEKPVHLAPGDRIWIPIHAIHRDSANYPNPDKFDPDRFSDENKHSIKPYTYMPFGVGPRNCIGNRFALLEIKIILFNLLLNFELIPTKRTQIPLKLSKGNITPKVDNDFWLALKRLKLN